jgi:hypothetical protein
VPQEESTVGNWNISIRGVGAHHNGVPGDANEMAKVFVQALKAAGHRVLGATVTYGAEEDLDPYVPPSSENTGPQ